MASANQGSEWRRYQDTSFLAKLDVPYASNAHPLQTLDIFVPDSLLTFNRTEVTTQSNNRHWIIYVHGGAWRDPKVTKSALRSAFENFITSREGAQLMSCVAGFASVNYTLSSRSKYTTSHKNDRSLQGVHPDHIQDVIRSIAFLLDLARHENLPCKKYILVGHSCGATLAFQVTMNHAFWITEDLPSIPKPEAVVGLAGLYDLPLLGKVGDPAYRHLEPVYQEFLKGAFGNEQSVWACVSPVAGNFGDTWPNGKLAILAQSHEDSLVSWEQTTSMKKVLVKTWESKQDSNGPKLRSRTIEEIELTGDHDDVWRNGKELSEVIIKALGILTRN